MNTDSKEHLSQLMDGEIGGETGRFVLRRLEASGELRNTWARYHLIRDCMRYQDRSFAGMALSTGVRRALQGSPEPGGQGLNAIAAGNRWLRPAAGLAVAATVALMAIIAVAPNLPTATGIEAGQVSAAEDRPFSSPNILSRPPVSRQVNLSGENESAARKMNSYLLRHYQVAGSSGGSGFVSFVPIVISKSTTQQSSHESEDAGSEAQESAERESDLGSP